MTNKTRSSICLWFNDDAESAARFYANTLPDSAVGRVIRAPGNHPAGQAGNVLTVEFTDDQQETDRYWNAIVGNGGHESMCGWCKDRWGISWQITPRVLIEAIAVGGDEAKRVFDAMMTMKKIDVAAIVAARRS
jgi:predicted 3-demethylubiquinone-9 3-methyltransferase (glyoxalase superfamily)